MPTLRSLPALLILLLAVVLAVAAWLGFALLTSYRNFPADGVFVDLPRGSSTRAIARQLVGNGVVRDALAFEVLARWRGRTLQAGEYFFDRPLTALEVYDMLAAGKVYVRLVTVPEGLNMFQIGELMEREGFATRDAFLVAAEDASAIRDLAPRAKNLEGFLFPATYELPRHPTAEQIVSAMVRRFRAVWDSLPPREAGADAVSAFEVVTLASLVERETRLTEERPLVAGVYYNRLRRGIALQCDPTVLYAMHLAGRNDGVIHQSDLSLNSPYNTYRHRGLPPGPIANPGKAALAAALHPPATDYLYFVSNTQGGHFFSKTAAQHNAKVAEYRRLAGLPPRPAPPPSSSSPKSASKKSQRRGTP
jgi:UPF0755 protein